MAIEITSSPHNGHFSRWPLNAAFMSLETNSSCDGVLGGFFRGNLVPLVLLGTRYTDHYHFV